MSLGDANYVDQGPVRSFATVSAKSNRSHKSTVSSKDIEMDIISYAPPLNDMTKKDALIQKEADAGEQGGAMVREKTVDTEEERFEQALKAIVEEVKDLKEKKPPKKRRERKSGLATDEKNHILRDVTPASPPFRTGRVKEAKPPKGLSNKEGTERKGKQKKEKNRKETSKRVKGKNEKSIKKKVTFEKEAGLKSKDLKGEPEESKEELKSEEVEREAQKQGTVEEKPKSFEKHDVPIIIQAAKIRSDSENEEEKSMLAVEVILEENEEEVENQKVEIEDAVNESPANVSKGVSFVSSSGFETDEHALVSSNDNDDEGDRRRINDRLQKRKIEAERRRLKVEQKRKEKEEAKRKLQEQAEREEQMRQEAELEMQKRMEEVKNRKKMEEEEKLRQKEEEIRRQKKAERDREKERKEKEELKRKMAAMTEKLRLEEQKRREEERLKREMEEEIRRQEEEMLKAMEEHERIEYERNKKEQEAERLRQQEEKQRIEAERRLIEEEEHRIKMQKLQEFHQLLLERAKFWEGMKNSKWFLDINQRLTRAFTFSYFDLLPAILFEFTSLRPFTPKENKFGILPTIQEERKEEKS